MIIFGMFTSTFANTATSSTRGTLTGKVVEESTKVPMPDANVLLFDANNHSQVSGTTTNEHGEFRFIDLPKGAYYVQVGFIGFKTEQTSTILIENNAEKIDLGMIEIEVSPIVLEGVEITAEESRFQQSIDRKVYHPEKALDEPGRFRQ